jgi:hypothetical protein
MPPVAAPWPTADRTTSTHGCPTVRPPTGAPPDTSCAGRIAKYGGYRTKHLILEIYDAMAHATATGGDYQTILSPAPGHGPRHPTRKA